MATEQTTSTKGVDDGYVLVVEDDDDLRWLLSDFLESEGYRVVAASGGLQALSVMAPGNRRPCLVLLDWNMPELDGRQVLARMLANPDLVCVPTYVVTAAPHMVPKDVPVIAKHDHTTILDAVHTHCHPSHAANV